MPVAVAGDTVAVSQSGRPAIDGLADVVSVRLEGVVAGVTICGTAAELLLPCVASPAYVAVSECCPAANVAIDTCASPPARLAVPTGTPLSKKITWPVAPAGDTVAVRVTAPPYIEGFGLVARLVVVAIACTVWMRTVELPASTLASPPQVPVTVCVPGERSAVVMDVLPALHVACRLAGGFPMSRPNPRR